MCTTTLYSNVFVQLHYIVLYVYNYTIYININADVFVYCSHMSNT